MSSQTTGQFLQEVTERTEKGLFPEVNLFVYSVTSCKNSGVRFIFP